MPNWTEIAKAIGTGLFGDEVQQYQGRKQAMANEATRVQLAQNADSRAAMDESRRSDEFEFDKGNRSKKIEQLDNLLRAGVISNEEHQNALDVFRAGGGASGAVQRTDEERLLKQRAAGRADSQLDIERGNAARMSESAARDAELHQGRLEKQGMDNRLERETLDSRIEEQLDPGNRTLLNQLSQQYTQSVRAGDLEGSKKIKDQYDFLVGEIQKRRVMRGINKQIVGPNR